ncbi:hypothetical protein EGW29_10090 [Enterococcus faecium]|nr:hypothetical protein EGW29_10090 [Enterococcus faecium]
MTTCEFMLDNVDLFFSYMKGIEQIFLFFFLVLVTACVNKFISSAASDVYKIQCGEYSPIY